MTEYAPPSDRHQDISFYSEELLDPAGFKDAAQHLHSIAEPRGGGGGGGGGGSGGHELREGILWRI